MKLKFNRLNCRLSRSVSYGSLFKPHGLTDCDYFIGILVRSRMNFGNIPPGLLSSSPVIKRAIAAIENHDVQMVEEIILEYGGCINSNINIVDIEMSLLHLAVGFSDNSPEIVSKFLQIGGDPNNVKGSEKLSPLHLCVINDDEQVLNVLLNHGGNPLLPTGDGKSCFHIALENRSDSLQEKCFELFFRRYCSFRQSLKNNTFDETSTIRISGISQLTSFSSDEDNTLPFFCSTPKERTPFRQRKANFSNLVTDDGRSKAVTKSSMQSGNDKPTTIFEGTSVFSSDTSEIRCSSDYSSWLSNSTSSSCSKKQSIGPFIKKYGISLPPATSPIVSGFVDDNERTEILANASTSYSTELHLALANLNLVNDWGQLKIDLLQTVASTSHSKAFYNYIILDPNIIKRCNFSGNHLKSNIINNAGKFETFLSAIIYIGKGCSNKPLQLLVEAKAKLKESRHKIASVGEKADKILKLWKVGLGVMFISVFHHSSEREANANVAVMIDAVGLVELGNFKGSYSGTIATQWSQKTRNQLGAYLLYKTFCSFVVGDTKSLHPSDI